MRRNKVLCIRRKEELYMRRNEVLCIRRKEELHMRRNEEGRKSGILVGRKSCILEGM